MDREGRIEHSVAAGREHMRDLVVTAGHPKGEVGEVQHRSAHGGSEHPGVLTVRAHVQLQQRVGGPRPLQQGHHFQWVFRPLVASQLTERGVEVDVCIGWNELVGDIKQIMLYYIILDHIRVKAVMSG